LTFNGYSNTLECLETHLKNGEKHEETKEPKPEIFNYFKIEKNYKKSENEKKLDKELLTIKKCHG